MKNINERNTNHISSPIDSSGLKLIFRSLYYKNFRLFFSGQLISLIGTWMQVVAMSWLVYRLTNSAFILGIVGFMSQIFAFIFTPFIGVLIDRLSRQRILVATQLFAMLQAFMLAFLTINNIVVVWQIIALSIFLGIVNAFEIPTRHSFVVDMIERKEDLGNAIALNSFTFNIARLIGPSIAGILIAVVGEGVCFLINGISYLAVILALLAMRIKPDKQKIKKSHALKELKEGLSYAYKFKPIRYILLIVAMLSIMGMSYTVLMPIFAKDILGGGAQTLGFLMAAIGVGALLGTLYLASHKSILELSKKIAISSGTFGIGLMIFSLSNVLWVSLCVLLIVGFAMLVQMASCNTVLQTIVDDDKRGRIMGLYTTAFLGMLPFGSLLAGSLAAKIGAPHTLLLGGALCILASFIFSKKARLLSDAVEHSYKKMGLNVKTEIEPIELLLPADD
jgi:MFS family permease